METKILNYLENLLECNKTLLPLSSYDNKSSERLEIQIDLLEEIIFEIKNNI